MVTFTLFVDSLHFEWVHYQWSCNIHCAYNGSKWIRKSCGTSASLHHVYYADAYVQFLCELLLVCCEETRIFSARTLFKFIAQIRLTLFSSLNYSELKFILQYFNLKKYHLLSNNDNFFSCTEKFYAQKF